MKDFRRLFVTLALLLGIVFQGICNGSSHLFHQHGYILLQAKGGFDPALLPVIIFLFLALVLALELSASKGSRSSEEQGTPTVGDWIVRYLLTAIPVVGFILLIVWALDGKNKPRKNWAVATIIWIMLVLIFFCFLLYLFSSYLVQNLGGF